MLTVSHERLSKVALVVSRFNHGRLSIVGQKELQRVRLASIQFSREKRLKKVTEALTLSHGRVSKLALTGGQRQSLQALRGSHEMSVHQALCQYMEVLRACMEVARPDIWNSVSVMECLKRVMNSFVANHVKEHMWHRKFSKLAMEGAEIRAGICPTRPWSRAVSRHGTVARHQNFDIFCRIFFKKFILRAKSSEYRQKCLEVFKVRNKNTKKIIKISW